MAKAQTLPVETGFEMRDSFIDPVTNAVVQVSEAQMRKLTELEVRLSYSITNLMLDLKALRDEKLYLLRCDTFEEYLRMIGVAPRTAYRQLQIADAFGDSKNFSELSKLPQALLLEVAKNDDLAQQLRDGEVRTSDGEILSIEEIINSGNVKLKAELEKAQKGFRNYKKKFEEADEDRKLRSAELDEYKEKLGSDFVRISKKKDAMAALFAAEGEINSVVTTLDRIDNDDVEVVGKLGALIGQIKYAMDALEDKWMPHFVKGEAK